MERNSSPFKYSIGSQLQWFQVRINHRLLPTKSYLHKIKVNDSPLCTTCNEEETLIHMLWTCPQTKLFIQQIRDLFMSKHINFIINEELYMFNIGRHYCEAELFLLLQMKYYIFHVKD